MGPQAVAAGAASDVLHEAVAMRGGDLIRAFLPTSPFAAAAGIEITSLEADTAALTMPFAPGVATMGDVVHGGAIATLVDTAAMVASWATDDVPDTPRGTTVTLTVSYVAAARGTDLIAHARVVRRGGTLCHCEVEVMAGDDVVAKGLVTYKLG
jgi:uncharacterized protein (TIGR00369 family)